MVLGFLLSTPSSQLFSEETISLWHPKEILSAGGADARA